MPFFAFEESSKGFFEGPTIYLEKTVANRNFELVNGPVAKCGAIKDDLFPNKLAFAHYDFLIDSSETQFRTFV